MIHSLFISKNMKAKIKDGLLIRNIAGEHVLIDASGEVDLSKMEMLNDTAVSIIKAMQEGFCTAEELAARIVAEYDVTVDQALADIKELLTAMSAKGLVTVND